MSEERFHELYNEARSLLEAERADTAFAVCNELFSLNDVSDDLLMQAESLMVQI